MSLVVRSLGCLVLVASSSAARAESAPAAHAASAANAPAAAADSAPAAREAAALRVYMRSDGQPLVFSARANTSRLAPNACVSPCNVALAPGDYVLRLNGVLASESLSVRTPGTLYGQYHSQRAWRDGGYLALNVGGIIGGVFITVAALGGPSWAYAAGGGSLAASGLIFLVTYRSDSATISFSPEEPIDARGMPAPVPVGRRALPALPERSSSRDQPRGLSLRVVF